MKRKTICWVLCVFSIAYSATQRTYAHKNDTVYVLSEADQRFLSYYNFYNTFDSATVMLTYGEVRLNTSSSSERLRPSWTPRVGAPWVHNPDQQGVQTKLDSLARWQPILISANSVLRFYREVSIKAYRHRTSVADTVQYSIADTTYVVLEARDVVNDTVVFVADSLGLLPSSSTVGDFYVGDSAHYTLRQFVIPSSAYGKTVYLVAKPVRYGPTAFGMSANVGLANISKSVVYRGRAAGFIPKSEYDALSAERFSRYLAWIDGVWRAYCVMPDFKYFAFDQWEIDTINSRYYRLDTIINGKNIYALKDCVGDSCGSFTRLPFTSGVPGTIQPEIAVILLSASIENNLLRVVIQNTGSQREVTLVAYNISGQTVGSVKRGVAHQSETVIELTLPTISTSVCLIAVSDSKSDYIARGIVPVR